ncbi:MAG: hypothetical protein NC928_01325, partial [Candidatus Omnitrophica bacterium]|nr:hypothetical protein [Candidatus Omnitrophota bacterium]
MNRKILVLSVLILLFGVSFTLAVDPATLAAQREVNARAKLKAQEWIVYLTPETGGATETDVITFTPDDKISSKNLLAQGYEDTNFRVSVGDDGSIV